MGKFTNKILAEFQPPRKWKLGRDLTYSTKDLMGDEIKALQDIGVKVNRDTVDTSYVYYQNNAVKTTKDKIEVLTLSAWLYDLDRGTELKDADFPADEDAKGNPVVETFSDCLPLKDVKRWNGLEICIDILWGTFMMHVPWFMIERSYSIPFFFFMRA